MRETREERRGCLALLARLFGPRGEPALPTGHTYRLRDDFLSPAEASLLHVLRDVTADWALICPKVRLADLVYPPRQEGRQAALNRISGKHLDFVLCDGRTLRPAVAVELDDRSHERTDRRERDDFVDEVLEQVGLPIVRVAARRGYDTRALAAEIAAARACTPVDGTTQPAAAGHRGDACPRCGGRLVRRVARQGSRAGEEFWGCSNYPRCRHTAAISP